MVGSFGDGRSLEEEEPEPPFGLPRIALMIVPVVDEEALEAVVEQVRDAIAQAVRAGFADAMGEMVVVDEDENEDETPEAPVEVPFDANPTVNSKDQYAYDKYAERLDREVPGWWRIPVGSMAPELRKLAAVRQVRDGAGPPSPPKPPAGRVTSAAW